MRLRQNFLALPTSLLLLLLSSPTAAHAENEDQSPAQWPNDRPMHIKYSPEDSSHRRQELEAIQSHISVGHAPVAVKKMSEDESEMFFPEYWRFREQVDQFAIFGDGPADGSPGWSLRKEFEEEDAMLLTNASTVLSMRPAFLVRAKQEISLSQRDIQAFAVRRVKGGRSAAAALALLEKRQFECPTGTSACSNAPSLCCATGEACVTVTDTGIGSIGCCPSGYTCSGTIQCVAGNNPCASDIGGGCCIPGDVCATVGCKFTPSTLKLP
jgi:progranulin